jgi:hypothetical protein
LTHLLRLGREEAPALGAAALGLLADASLRAGVARALQARGVPDSAEALGRSLGDLHGRRAPGPLLAALLSLCLELGQLEAVEGRMEPLASVTHGPGAELFAAVLASVGPEHTPLAPLLELSPADAASFARLRSSLAESLPAEVLSFARALLADASRAPSPAPPPEARP